MEKITFDAVTAIAAKFASELPAQITRALADVEILVCEDVTKATARLLTLIEEPLPEEIPAECKGIFVGEPMEIEESDQSETEEVTLDPSGFIVLIVANIKDAEECSLVLMHETAHAMGWDEDEVKRLGLGFVPVTPENGGANVEAQRQQTA